MKKQKLKNVFNQTKYAIVPFIMFVLTLVIAFFGNQLLYSAGLIKGSNWCELPIDSKIPLIPWFVYFYYLTFPLCFFTFFYLAYKDKKAFYNIYITLILSFALSGIIYLVGQTVFTKPDFTPVTFTDKLVVWTWGSTNPVNCFPSQHCFMAFATIIACVSGKGMNKIFKAFAIFCSIMIVLSTVFIRQHFVMDIVASFDIMFIFWIFAYVFKFGEKWSARKERKALERADKKSRRGGDF